MTPYSLQSDSLVFHSTQHNTTNIKAVEILTKCVYNRRSLLWQHLVILHYPYFTMNISMGHSDILEKYDIMPTSYCDVCRSMPHRAVSTYI
jgi:hypothetical protein